ncbi:MAG: hypothetical protein L6R37_000917 [Teloschistes peruensis]|nr:MAG: hypothetical protein L6R37_000917 [Teloschistes peruensis]
MAYTLSSQCYVSKLLKKNIENNVPTTSKPQGRYPPLKKKVSAPGSSTARTLEFVELDWETTDVQSLQSLLAQERGASKAKIDMVIACDCIYNESLVAPFVRTCMDLCRLTDTEAAGKPTICVIAQQLRSPEVFEAWLTEFLGHFQVWRMPDAYLSGGLRANSGFVIHVGILLPVNA